MSPSWPGISKQNRVNFERTTCVYINPGRIFTPPVGLSNAIGLENLNIAGDILQDTVMTNTSQCATSIASSRATMLTVSF